MKNRNEKNELASVNANAEFQAECQKLNGIQSEINNLEEQLLAIGRKKSDEAVIDSILENGATEVEVNRDVRELQDRLRLFRKAKLRQEDIIRNLQGKLSVEVNKEFLSARQAILKRFAGLGEELLKVMDENKKWNNELYSFGGSPDGYPFREFSIFGRDSEVTRHCIEYWLNQYRESGFMSLEYIPREKSREEKTQGDFTLNYRDWNKGRPAKIIE